MLTVKQIADRAGVSKTTVKRHLKRIENTNGTEYIKQNMKTEPNGVILISEQLADQLHKAMIKPEYTVTQDHNAPQHVPERSKTDHNVETERSGTITGTDCNGLQRTATERNGLQHSEIIVALNRVIETQQAQIDQLNRTIEQYQQDKEDLKKQIETLSVLLSQQQQLHQTLQVKLLETEQEPTQDEAEPTEQPKKKGLFGIFKKKEKKGYTS